MVTVEKNTASPPIIAIIPPVQARTREKFDNFLTPSPSKLIDKIAAELNSTHSWDEDDQIALADWDEQFDIERS